MQRKKMTLRFDLDRPEDRQAWEYLQGLNSASMNKAVLAIINHADRANRVQRMIRNIFREELATALKQLPVQPVRAEPEGDDGMDDTIMDFLDNFM
ncbi:MAG: hypothetical protein LUG44_02610 [Clostridiales bacterium]|nr:hypothetical protein [Clostridiales bacterium]